jgi:hypothetical protein
MNAPATFVPSLRDENRCYCRIRVGVANRVPHLVVTFIGKQQSSFRKQALPPPPSEVQR